MSDLREYQGRDDSGRYQNHNVIVKIAKAVLELWPKKKSSKQQY